MIKAVLSLCLGLWLVVGLAGNARAEQVHLTGAAVIPVAEGELGGMDEIFRMDAPRLVFLGAGIVVGAVVISPALGVNELLGVVVGVVASEFLYRTTYLASERSSYWIF
jgi:ammonia channel protein AmtB